jgi:hypothetical protein
MVELLLDTIMSPLILAELRQLNESCDLSLEHSKIGPTGTGIKIPLFMGALSRPKAVLSFCQIYLPVHNLILPAPMPPLHAATNVRRALVSKSLALITAALQCGEETFALEGTPVTLRPEWVASQPM